MDRAIHVRLGLNQTRGDERDHQLVALAEMIAARIATAALPSSAALSSATCSSACVVPPKFLWVERFDEFNLECVASLLLGTRSLLSGQKPPCSRFEGISPETAATQGFVGVRATLKRLNPDESPVNVPDTRGTEKKIEGGAGPLRTQFQWSVEFRRRRTVADRATTSKAAKAEAMRASADFAKRTSRLGRG